MAKKQEGNKVKNILKHKIDAEQAEEQGGFVVFEEYAPEKIMI